MKKFFEPEIEVIKFSKDVSTLGTNAPAGGSGDEGWITDDLLSASGEYLGN